MKEKRLYDISDIKAILPHRSPFLFVTRVIKFIGNDTVVAEKDLSPDEDFFAGHFPGNPIMPGVIVSEALAQTSGLLLGLIWQKNAQPFDQKKQSLLLGSVNIKFFTPARPGDTLSLKATLKKIYGDFFLFHVAAHVSNNPVAKGTLTLARTSS
jgi:3-hydroxyacyl-[acyl-carrier-protein] dehydratase